MTYEELVPIYDRFLDSVSPWKFFLCDGCGYVYTHPGNYCYKCTGKLHQTQLTWFEFIKNKKKMDRIIGAETSEFMKFLGQNWEQLEIHSEVEPLCYKRLRERLK